MADSEPKLVIQLLRKQLFLFDGDGVIYAEDTPLSGAADLFRWLAGAGKRCVLLTNNSTAPRSVFVRKLAGMGISLAEKDVYTSAYSTIALLARGPSTSGDDLFEGLPRAGSVHIIGERGITAACEEYGIKYSAGETLPQEFPDAVVVGMDRALTYNKLAAGLTCLRAGAVFAATNADSTFPLRGGGVAPGAGAVVAALSCSADRSPDALVGKPSALMFRQVLEQHCCKPEDAVMVGDRFETDIIGAKNAGIDAVLVRTGIAEQYEDSQIAEWQREQRAPAWVFRDLVEMLEALRSASHTHT